MFNFLKGLFVNKLEGETMAMTSIYEVDGDRFTGRYKGTVVHKGKKYFKYELENGDWRFSHKEATLVKVLSFNNLKEIKMSDDSNHGLFKRKQMSLITVRKG